MKTLHNCLHRLKEDTGQSLIEFILIVPILFLLILNAVNFGGLFYAWITVTNASRAGANYAILGGSGSAAVDAQKAASGIDVYNMIHNEISSLPNNATVVVNVCQQNNTVTTVLYGTCTSIPADTEPASFVLTSVDVSYHYTPFLSGYQFPKLGVYLTAPPTNVHVITQMRTIQ